MATKKFAQMSNKKLNALIATASDEDKVAIQEVLDARAQASAAEASNEEESQLTPEEQAAIDAAEKNGGINPEYAGRTVSEKKPRATDEERHALAEELKKNVGHRCQAVPFNTVEWVDGYIAGVMEEKRTNKVLYAIKTDDGRRIVKVHDSNLLRIFDEVVEIKKAQCVGRKAKDPSEKKPEWTQEVLEAEISQIIGNVGRVVEFEKYRTVDQNGDEHIEMVQGRIIAIVPDKRSQRLLYRISVPTPIEGNPLAAKIMHKVSTFEGLTIAEEFDEVGAEMNAKYVERREHASARTPITPQDRVIKCEEDLKKAEERLAKIQEEIEAKTKRLEEAKAELQVWLDSQSEQVEDSQAGSEEESLA